MAERREGDGKDPVWIEQGTVNVVEREEGVFVTGIFWIATLFTL
jgi:hypothetical protein